MDDTTFLAERFEQERTRLRAVAYRMLGSTAEADDAVQEAWLRLSRTDAAAVENLPAWLTTVVSRVCLNMLRSRTTRRESPLQDDPLLVSDHDPEQEAVLADSVGLALLVVLDTLTPAERLAFVLHDLFDLPFDEVAPIAARGAGPAASDPTPPWRARAGSPTPTWRPSATVTSRRWSPCSTPTSSCGPTPPRTQRDGRWSCTAATPSLPGRSPRAPGRGTAGPRWSTAAPA